MRFFIPVALILGLNACVLDNAPKRYVIDVTDMQPMCVTLCNRHEGISDIGLKIITGTPTDFVISCKCNDGYYEEWTKSAK